MFNFIITGSIMSVLIILYKRDNRTVHYLYSTYDSLFKNLNEYGLYIKSYFQTLFTYTLLSLMFSLFQLPNNILNNGDFSLFYILSLFNLLLFISLGLRKNGPLKIINSFYMTIGNSKWSIPLNLFVSILLFTMNYILKPIVLPSRIVLNGMIGESMHHCMETVPGGFFINFIVTSIKIIIYIIQAYIFYMFSVDLFAHLYKIDNGKH